MELVLTLCKDSMAPMVSTIPGSLISQRWCSSHSLPTHSWEEEPEAAHKNPVPLGGQDQTNMLSLLSRLSPSPHGTVDYYAPSIYISVAIVVV